MKRTVVEQLALQYVKLAFTDPKEKKIAYLGFIEGFKRSSLFLDEIVNDHVINDFFKGRISVDET